MDGGVGGATKAPVEFAEQGSAGYVYLVSVVAALGGLLFGFDTAVINGALVFLKKQFALAEVQTEVAASSLLLGCVLGAGVAGTLSDRLGRKRILLAAAALFLLSSVGAALPRNLAEFVAARLLGGVAIGLASTLAPVYIAEIAPARIRGRLVTLNQMAIVTGILCSFVVSWLLTHAGPDNWRWMFLSAALPSLGFFVALFFVPESPRWLIRRQRSEEALGILARIAGRAEGLAQMEEIRRAIAEEEASVLQLLKPGLRRALLIGVVLAVASQLTGINTILYYGSILFTEQAGRQSEAAALWANLVIGATNFLTTIVAILVIDKLGRKPLLLFALGGMTVSLGLLGLAFRLQPAASGWILGLILCFVFCFAIGMGPGAWLVLSEIFPTSVRGRAMSIATISLWVTCFLITLTFLSLVTALTASGAFWLYGALCSLTFLFVLRVVPETKGRTLEEIERFWMDQRISRTTHTGKPVKRVKSAD